MAKNYNTFANRLRLIRGGVSQEKAAKLIPHMSVNTLRGWEQENRTPTKMVQQLVLDKMVKEIRKKHFTQ
jgi:DNA-binding transcriptional regulator YiaG